MSRHIYVNICKHPCVSPDRGNIFMVAEIEQDIQVGVEDRLAQIQVFDASLENIKHWYYHLLEGTHLLVGEQASNGLLHKLNHLLWL